MAYRVTILSNRETLTLGKRGELVRVRRIEYSIGNHGPFVYEVPVDAWDLEDFKRIAQEKAKEISELEGMEV